MGKSKKSNQLVISMIHKEEKIYTSAMSVAVLFAALIFLSIFLVQTPNIYLIILSMVFAFIVGLFIIYSAWRLSKYDD